MPAATATDLQPVPMLDFRRDFAPIREEVLAAVTAAIDSQRFILGPEVASFEAAAATACNVPHAIGCASGTDALWLALAALNIGQKSNGERDRVLTTPFSFFATASAILRAGATPVFADIDERTFNLSAKSAAELLGQNLSGQDKAPIAAILPVHLYGQCANMADLGYLATRHNLKIVEDAAQAFGATWNGTRAGGLGDIAAFSFYPTKNLAAMGDAGMTTTRDPALAERMTMLRAHGMRSRYYHDELGWNSRLDTLQAAILEVKLRHVEAGNQRRGELACLYHQLFQSAGIAGSNTTEGIVLPYVDPRAGHVFHQYVIRAPRRDALREHLTAHSIGTEVYYPLSLHQQTSLASLGYKTGDFPHAERAAAEVLALPMYPGLRNDEVETVVEAVRRFYQ